MPDYSKGKIYKITSPSLPGKCYIGSTTCILHKRMINHKSACKRKTNRKITSKLILCYGDAIIELIEDYPCANNTELERREGFHIREHMNNDEMDDVVNHTIAGRTLPEWREDNKKYIQNWHKEYYDTHKDHKAAVNKAYRINKKAEIKIRRAVKINCQLCGILTNKDNIRTHQRTKKCQAIQEQKSKNGFSV